MVTQVRKLPHPYLMLLSGVCLALCCASIGQATVVSLDANHDTMIFQNNPNNGAGGAPGFVIGTSAQPSIRRGMVSFDLSSIPSNATITDVQLQLKIGQIAGAGGGGGSGGSSHPTIDLHKLNVSWGEANTGASTANNLGGAGQGSPAQDGDATWNARFFSSTSPVLWSSPGGAPGVDYSSAISASLVQSDTLNDFSVWLSTAALVADVQSWLGAGSVNNFGWMLINENESDPQTFRGFYSRNFNPSPTVPDLNTYFPALIVTYAVPEPSTIVLGFVALAFLFPWRLDRSTPCV